MHVGAKTLYFMSESELLDDSDRSEAGVGDDDILRQ